MTDPAKTLFETGVAFLKQKDVKNPRPVIGRWRKTHGDGEILKILQTAIAQDVTEPVGYITKALAGPQNSDIMQELLDDIARG